jgi:hypothetical protein
MKKFETFLPIIQKIKYLIRGLELCKNLQFHLCHDKLPAWILSFSTDCDLLDKPKKKQRALITQSKTSRYGGDSQIS